MAQCHMKMIKNLDLVLRKCPVFWMVICQLLCVSARIWPLRQPEVSISPINVTEGDNVTFHCKIKYNGKVEINWAVPHTYQKTARKELQQQSERMHDYKDEEENIEAIYNISSRAMILTNVSKQDEGNYTCKVIDASYNRNNIYAHPRQSKYKAIQLSVIPAGVPKLDLDIRGYYNKSTMRISEKLTEAIILVDITSNPPPLSIVWYDNKMNPILSNRGDYKVEYSLTLATLIIDHPMIGHSGIYVLEVKNKYLKNNVVIKVKV
ncbi:uncharacterized protein LOC128986932 [Macrosteles quadrilineatus]|uniref:uncharacterized protein LOC128986932 n=1 Tax=Macrosteles quadrilineatus TaxID=74068 RepID=UPI0023E170DF|nr:uncharacterized protein LOC128986932 [Macrosteles quadrilineatus]